MNFLIYVLRMAQVSSSYEYIFCFGSANENRKGTSSVGFCRSIEITKKNLKRKRARLLAEIAEELEIFVSKSLHKIPYLLNRPFLSTTLSQKVPTPVCSLRVSWTTVSKSLLYSCEEPHQRKKKKKKKDCVDIFVMTVFLCYCSLCS